jgi:hypothetical protein
MAEKAPNLESSKDLFGNFNISDTIEMAGNQELLEELYASDSATGSPDELEKIEEGEKTKPISKTKEVPKTDDKKSSKELAEEARVKAKQEADRKLNNLLEGKETEEEEEEPSEEGDEEEKQKPTKSKTSEEAPKEEDSQEEGGEKNQFEVLSQELLNLGVFSKEDEEDDVIAKTPEQFLERFNFEKEKGAREMVNNFISQFGEDRRHAFSAIFEKGVDPKEYFSTYNKIENLSEIDLTKEENQVVVVRAGLVTQGFEPADVEGQIQKLKDYGDLEDMSQKYQKILVKKEAEKLSQLEQESELKLRQQAEVKNQYVKNVNTVLQNKLKDKEFDGIPINPKLAGELQDFLLVDKWKTPSGETLTDFDRTILELKRPENHETKVKIALLLKILEKDPTLSTIQKSGVTKKSNTLFGELVKQSSKTSVKSSKQSGDSKSLFSEYL